MTKSNEPAQHIRIDKWLWAARFFKTRSIAKAAIEGGKVHHHSERVKVSRTVQIGMQLTIQQGFEKKVILVTALSNVRRGAPEAQLLYQETTESLKQREIAEAQRKLNHLAHPDHRPTKKDRREIVKFHQAHNDSTQHVWFDDE